MPLSSFEQAIKASNRYNKKHVLLGNGFSIACRPDIFVYGKLFERADFSKLSPGARKAFDALGTQDFEKVIKALRDASKLLSAYPGNSAATISALQKDANGLLINGVRVKIPQKRDRFISSNSANNSSDYHQKTNPSPFELNIEAFFIDHEFRNNWANRKVLREI